MSRDDEIRVRRVAAPQERELQQLAEVLVDCVESGASVSFMQPLSHERALVLDTASADAERLYERLGWQAAGVVPDYALLPQGGYCDTRFYYRRLTP